MLGALYLGKDKGMKIAELEKPVISGPDDVIIKMRACGICGSDLHTLELTLPKPVVLGHECAGEVAEVGRAVRNVAIGDHVVVDPNFYCGTCRNCLYGRTNLCENLVELGVLANGGFAEYLLVPGRFAMKISRDVDWTTAAVVEPLSCVIHGFLKARLVPGQSAVVFGAGPIGLLWVYLLRRAGAKMIISVDISSIRRKAAADLGADVAVDPLIENTFDRVKKETQGYGVNVAVEAIGKAETVESAVRSLANGGRAILMGVASRDALARISPLAVMGREIEILGTNSQVHSFLDAIRLIESREFPTKKFVSHELPLSDIVQAFDMNRKGESLKTIIHMH